MKDFSKEAGKTVLAEMFKTGESASEIADRLDLWSVSDPWDILYLCRWVVWDDSKDLVDQYLDGKEQVINVLVGKAIKRSNKKMDPSLLKLGLQIAIREYSQCTETIKTLKHDSPKKRRETKSPGP